MLKFMTLGMALPLHWMLLGSQWKRNAGPQPGEGRKRKKGAKRPGAKRKTRGQLAEQRGPKSFATILDEVTAAVKPYI